MDIRLDQLPGEVVGAYRQLAQIRVATSLQPGLSGSKVWRVDTQSGDYALKAMPEASADAERMAWVARHLPTGNHLMACPEQANDGERWVCAAGFCWQVRRWIAGEPVSAPSEGEVAIDGLAELHAEWAHVEPGPAEAPSEPLLARRLDALEHLSVDTTDLAGAVHAARTAMVRARRPAGVQLIHGDARPANVLLRGGRCVGWIDDGAVCWDSPWRDVARLAGELADGDRQRRTALVSRYCRAAGAVEPLGLVEGLDLAATVVGVLRWRDWLCRGCVDREGGTRRLKALEYRLERLIQNS